MRTSPHPGAVTGRATHGTIFVRDAVLLLVPPLVAVPAVASPVHHCHARGHRVPVLPAFITHREVNPHLHLAPVIFDSDLRGFDELVAGRLRNRHRHGLTTSIEGAQPPDPHRVPAGTGLPDYRRQHLLLGRDRVHALDV